MKRTLVLKDAYKTFTLDQDKTASPGETVQQVKQRLNAIDLDVLSDTVRIDNGRLNIPVYFSICGKDAAVVCSTHKQMGKGATPEQAEASATMELVERFSFYSFMKDRSNFIIGKAKNLSAETLAFDRIAASVHDRSDDVEKAQQIFENLELKWTWGHHLTRDIPILVPFDWFYTINEFNGASTGNCVEEALCQGICEVVERHVSSLISRNRITPAAIDPKSPIDPMVVEMIEKYTKNRIQIYISDFTLDMGIPTVGVLAYDPLTFPDTSEIVWTAGTATHPEKALSRALSETAQLGGDFNSGANYVASGLPKLSSIAEAGHVINAPGNRHIRDLPNISHDNVRIEVERCVAALSEKAMEVVVVDTSHPRLGLPAFYTLVPGAHFRERAENTSAALFSTKIIAEQYPPEQALFELIHIDEHILPNKYFIKFYIGKCHLALERPEQALTYFEQALNLEPVRQDAASVYSYMGVCLKEMERFEEALAVLEKGRRIDDERTDIHNLMGFCRFKLKDHHQAIASFKKVIALNPGSAIDYANIGVNYRELGDVDSAVHFFRTALALDPTLTFARDALEKLTA
ncbi:MAG: YcaO-like family protein [Desulfobacterales bacterium]